jgi:hypothetical protein
MPVRQNGEEEDEGQAGDKRRNKNLGTWRKLLVSLRNSVVDYFKYMNKVMLMILFQQEYTYFFCPLD